jgi:hypothetical protein
MNSATGYIGVFLCLLIVKAFARCSQTKGRWVRILELNVIVPSSLLRAVRPFDRKLWAY